MSRPSASAQDTSGHPIDIDTLDGLLWERLDAALLNDPRIALLNEAEAMTVAELLDELAAVYAGEKLGNTARILAVRIYDRLGV